MSNPNNSNPFGINLANTSMKNSFFSMGSDIKQGNIHISSVYDPNRPPTAGTTIENVTVDINTKKDTGDLTIQEIPIGAKLAGGGQAAINRPTQQAIAPAPAPEKPQIQAQSSAISSTNKFQPAPPRPGDTFFTLANGIEIQAFKSVLSAKSPIFSALIKKATASGSNQVSLPLKVPVFEAMLDFFDDEDTLDRELAEELLQLGHKYGIADLKAKCELLLIQKLSFSSAAKLLLLSEKNKAAKLKAKVIEYIKECPSIKNSEEFQEIMEQEPSLMLELD